MISDGILIGAAIASLVISEVPITDASFSGYLKGRRHSVESDGSSASGILGLTDPFRRRFKSARLEGSFLDYFENEIEHSGAPEETINDVRLLLSAWTRLDEEYRGRSRVYESLPLHGRLAVLNIAHFSHDLILTAVASTPQGRTSLFRPIKSLLKDEYDLHFFLREVGRAQARLLVEKHLIKLEEMESYARGAELKLLFLKWMRSGDIVIYADGFLKLIATRRIL